MISYSFVMRNSAFLAALGAATGAAPALAHTVETAGGSGRFDASAVDAFGIALLALLGAAYAIGQWRVGVRSRVEHRGGSWYFWAGWTMLAIALVPPLDQLSAVSFAAHMTQHEIMMLVAAPLFVLARPLGTLLWGLPPAFAAAVKSRAVRGAAAWICSPLAAWLLHAVVLWGWHVPAAFEAGLRSEPVHWLQHASFFAAAIVFWWSVFASGRHGDRRGVALVSIFTTAVHTAVLGALLTFSTKIWYPAYASAANPWAFPAIEDQQLGGLIMWVPGGLAFLAAGIAIAALWLKESELKTARS